MSNPDEKKSMKPLNYYNEMSAFSKQIHYPNVRFLGMEYINDNPLMRFQLENGKHFRRQLFDNSIYYEPITNNNYTDEEIQNIKFIKITEDNPVKF